MPHSQSSVGQTVPMNNIVQSSAFNKLVFDFRQTVAIQNDSNTQAMHRDPGLLDSCETSELVIQMFTQTQHLIYLQWEPFSELGDKEASD